MLKFIAIGMSGMMGLFCMIGVYAVHTGIAIVDIRDKTNDERFFVPVPVGLVNAGMNMIPTQITAQVRGELGPHQELIQKLALELENLPDGDFVEVETKREHVLISKSGRNLVIDVDTPDESVYVRVPIRATGSIVAKLAGSVED